MNDHMHKADYKESILKEKRLIASLEQYKSSKVVVAFSGGVDSAYLLDVLCKIIKYSGTVYAIIANTKLHPLSDIEIAKKTAESIGAVFEIISIDELSDSEIEFNPINRCYLCKKNIFSKIIKRAEELEAKAVFDGTNYDDLGEYRPGIKALKELNVKSPLADNNIKKQDIRYLANIRNISVHDKPSAPCLATRIPYGEKLDYELLKKIDKAEEFLKGFGFKNVRIRVHGDIARIEVDKCYFIKIMEKYDFIVEFFKKIGFIYITLDLEGFRSGSMDI